MTSLQGTWQYRDGSTWVDIGIQSEASALILSASTLIRFLRAADFNGTAPSLTAYLLDSSGAAVVSGATLDVSINGGTSNVSDTPVVLGTSVTAQNDTPVVPASAAPVTVAEQNGVVLLPAVTMTDVDLAARNSGNGDYSGASLVISRATPDSSDLFSLNGGVLFTVSGTNLQSGGLTFATFTASGGILTVNFTGSATQATQTLVDDVTQSIRYANASDTPPSSVTLAYSFSDGAPASGQGGGSAATSASGTVSVSIAPVNDAPAGAVTVAGVAAEDQVLTASHTLTDADGLGAVSYQWLRGGVAITGATGGTYTQVQADVGAAISVTASYTDLQGTPEAVSSAPTGTVANVNDAPAGTVTVAAEDQVLTASHTLTDADGLGAVSYQWLRGGVAITGATPEAVTSAATGTVASGRPGTGLVDTAFYYANNPDVLNAGVDAVLHYHNFGWREGRDPSAFFDTDGYVSANLDVIGIDPLQHYLEHGWREGRDPSTSFDTQLYLQFNPDVANARMDPLSHYLAFGRAEGRATYGMVGEAVFNGFDAEFYLLANPDVGAAGANPLQHFQNHGWEEGRDPNGWFDTAGYLNTYSDVREAGMNPLAHYLQHGAAEGRDPSAEFDTSSYLAAYHDVAAAGVNPLLHFLQYGLQEGRQSFDDGLLG